MNTLYMKIQSFEEQSNSLIVSFASDTTQSQNPDDYPAYAYQPVNMWPDITDPAEIKKRIAISGIHLVEQQERHESLANDLTKLQAYKNMVGQESSYSISELTQTEEAQSPIESVLVL